MDSLRRLRFGEQPLALIDRQQEPRRTRRVEIGLNAARLGRLGERFAKRRERSGGIARQQAREQRLVGEGALRELRADRRSVQKAFGQRIRGVRSRRKDGDPPEIDLRDRPRQSQTGQQSGAQQRRLPAPLAPRINRNGSRLSSAPASRSRSIDCRIASSRPKNTASRVASKDSRPGNGDPCSSRSHRLLFEAKPRLASHWRRQSSIFSAKSSVEA